MCQSVGPDCVYPRLLKELSSHLYKPLARYLIIHWLWVNYQRNGNREGYQLYLRRVLEKTQEIINQSA